jgi:hypothetical protein
VKPSYKRGKKSCISDYRPILSLRASLKYLKTLNKRKGFLKNQTLFLHKNDSDLKALQWIKLCINS